MQARLIGLGESRSFQAFLIGSGEPRSFQDLAGLSSTFWVPLPTIVTQVTKQTSRPSTRLKHLHTPVLVTNRQSVTFPHAGGTHLNRVRTRLSSCSRHLTAARGISLSTSEATIFVFKVMSKKTGEYAQEQEHSSLPSTAGGIPPYLHTPMGPPPSHTTMPLVGAIDTTPCARQGYRNTALQRGC